MEEPDLLDIYRQFHADTKSCTYETKNSKLNSRIEFFLVSRPISYNVKRTEVRSSIAPDHKAIFLGMVVQSELKRGPGTWKFNNALLEDQYYIDLMFYLPSDIRKIRRCRKRATSLGIDKDGTSSHDLVVILVSLAFIFQRFAVVWLRKAFIF